MSSSNILIKNIYYMLSYAFSILKQSSIEKVSGEAFDNIHNLFAAILGNGIGQQLKRGLHREYILQHDNISMVRGKINIQETVKNRLNRTHKIACEFDELSENNILNQILKTTVLLLIKQPDVDSKHKNDLKQKMLFFSNVDVLDPCQINWSKIRFQRHNHTYRILISLCQFILEGMLLTNEAGENKLASFVDEQRLCKLYEKFILEYYRKHYPELNANASQIPWAVDDDCRTMLPTMQSDITLSYNKKTLIIDAKCYNKNTQNQYDKRTIHSANLYQIFTYVKNKTFQDGFTDHDVSGLLLYARTADEIQPDGDFSMSGNQISVKTLDLNQPFAAIAEQLNQIAAERFRTSENKKNTSGKRYPACGQKCSLASSVKINDFARKWHRKFFDRHPDVGEGQFAEESFSLGFGMDQGKWLIETFPDNDVQSSDGLKEVINRIDDIFFLGTAIFSYWRYQTHWADMCGFSIYSDEAREWLLAAFERLIELTKN